MQCYINWLNFITRLCLLSQVIQQSVFRVSCLGIWWRHEIWISENLKFDHFKNKMRFQSETKNTLFLVSQGLSFRHAIQTSKNVADTTLNNFFFATNFLMQYLNKPNLLPNIWELLRKEIWSKVTNLPAFIQNVDISQIESISFCKTFTDPQTVLNFAMNK